MKTNSKISSPVFKFFSNGKIWGLWKYIWSNILPLNKENSLLHRGYYFVNSEEGVKSIAEEIKLLNELKSVQSLSIYLK